jgi:GT2 family glycosyltransferase
MSQPRLSVVMSVYNGMPFLEEAVRSILGQSASDLEFLVVDDGSDDGSAALLQQWRQRDERMTVLCHRVNQGVARSRNAALRLARGAFVACQDADDVSLPDRLSRQAAYLDGEPEVGMVGTQVSFLGEPGSSEAGQQSDFPVRNEDLQSQLLVSNCFCAGSVMMRREVLDRVGFYDQALAPSEDYDLWLRLAEVAKIANLPDVLYQYRLHDGSASSQNRGLQMHRKAIALQRALLRREGKPLSSSSRQAIVRDFLRAACIGAAAGEIEVARLSAEQAIELAGGRDITSLIADVVLRYAEGHWGADARKHVATFFDDVLPPGPASDKARRRVLSQLYIGDVFDGTQAAVDRRLLLAVRDDPRWLSNRGVWSIGLRHLTSIWRKADGVTSDPPHR